MNTLLKPIQTFWNNLHARITASRQEARHHKAGRHNQRYNERQMIAQDRARRRAEARESAEFKREQFKARLHTASLLSLFKLPSVQRWALRGLVATALISLVANVLMYYRFAPTRPVVHIGSRVINEREYRADLDATASKAVLSKLVYGELIKQAAKKAGLMPTDEEIKARMAAGQNGSKAPSADDANAHDTVALGIALENLRMRGITVSDAEIAAYYAQHKNEYAHPPQVKSTLVVTSSAADAAQAERSLSEGMSEGAIANLPRMHVAGTNGFQVNLGVLPPATRNKIIQSVLALNDSGIKTFHVQNYFFTFMVRQHVPGDMPSLAQMRDQIARQIKLQKAPPVQEELATLYKENPPTFDVPRYEAYFSDVNSLPPEAPKTSAKPAPKTAQVP